ncbi:MAG: hypothetical protein MUE61_21085 [Vicinamibacterales bacterium]|jgi:photosystem II stability/assembly factor-like uncharacterized protein|nr:hypothetical protein [Vicinamibacterales bacterium]
MMPVFPARRGLALALLTCGLGVLHAAGQSSGTPPGASGQATTAGARARAWQTHLDLGDASPFRPLHWEPLGPSLQGGRIEAIAVAAPGSSTVYVGPGAGNVWKTTNNGMTWDPVFEHESAFAIGDIAVAPSSPNVVWVGTGEVQPRHSGPAFSGTGVFKSTDAGRTWRNMGLADTHHIGKIVVDAKNPDIVYVAAMGHAWSPNEERGVFKTVDGGATWTKSLYVNDRTGAIDLVMDPSDPKILYASLWQIVSGPESGIYKTTDAGRTWVKLGNGLPAGPIGRSNVDVARSNPRVVYAFLDNATPTPTPAPAPPPGGGRARPTIGGEVYRSDDKGATWRRANAEDLYEVFGIYGWKFCDIRVAPDNENEVYILGNRMYHSSDGGRTYARIGETIRRVNPIPGTAMHLDHHELWIDPANPARLILGNDGGVFTSWDRGRTWLHLNTLPIGQFYSVSADEADPYTIYAGTQDTGALMGASTWRPNEDPGANDGWRYVWLDKWTGGDAFVTLPDPTDPRWVYYEHQNGAMRRIDITAGNPFSGGPATEIVRPEAPRGEKPYRFGWFTPFLISQHDPRTLYAGANVVLKTTNRAAAWRAISPDLGETPGGERAVVPYGSITTLSESRFAPGFLYAGTEGGHVWVTRNDGGQWTDVSGNLPRKWVTRVVASRHDAGTVYVSMTGYREDDVTAYLYRSTDFGATWTAIANNLPAESINVVAEDPKRPGMLYIGTDAGVYVSMDHGAAWLSLCADLPTTPVMDLVVHQRENEIVIATHGRSLFLLDVRPVQALSDAVRASDLHLFDVRPVRLTWQPGREVPPQPPRGRALLHVWLKTPSEVEVAISDADRRAVRTMVLRGSAGVNRVEWDIRRDDGRDAPPGVYRADVTAGTRKAAGDIVVSPGRR